MQLVTRRHYGQHHRAVYQRPALPPLWPFSSSRVPQNHVKLHCRLYLRPSKPLPCPHLVIFITQHTQHISHTHHIHHTLRISLILLTLLIQTTHHTSHITLLHLRLKPSTQSCTMSL